MWAETKGFAPSELNRMDGETWKGKKQQQEQSFFLRSCNQTAGWRGEAAGHPEANFMDCTATSASSSSQAEHPGR